MLAARAVTGTAVDTLFLFTFTSQFFSVSSYDSASTH
jgi:hypothetical protein